MRQEYNRMAKKNRKYFEIPNYVEYVIKDSTGVIGTIRIKPSTVMWKTKGAKGPKPWRGVSIDELEKWITSSRAPATDMAQ